MEKTYDKNDNFKNIPNQLSEPDVLYFLQTQKVNWSYVDTIKKLTSFTDDVLAGWFNVTVKTFRSYKKSKTGFKANVKEHIVVLLSLIKHGIKVFGSSSDFNQWLDTPNFHFDNQKPSNFLNTITGIRFVDDRLTSIEYGDNV